MSALAADVLEILLEADPKLRIYEEDGDIILSFNTDREVTLVIKGPLDNLVNRVSKAMTIIAYRMVFCHHCPHMSTQCAVETMGMYGGLRMALGIDQMQKLEGRLRRAFPSAKIDLC